MGLSWAKPRLVKQNKLILVKATMPGTTNPELNSKLWDLWRERRDEIKDMGFSVSKDQRANGVWNIVCFIENTTENNIEIDVGGKTKKKWEIDFDENLKKLELMLGKVKPSEKKTYQRRGQKKQYNSDYDDPSSFGTAVSLDDISDDPFS